VFLWPQFRLCRSAYVEIYLPSSCLGFVGGSLCEAQHGLFNWAKPGLHTHLNVPVYTLHRKMAVYFKVSRSLDGARKHFKT
jgi:hypothetical protein